MAVVITITGDTAAEAFGELASAASLIRSSNLASQAVPAPADPVEAVVARTTEVAGAPMKATPPGRRTRATNPAAVPQVPAAAATEPVQGEPSPPGPPAAETPAPPTPPETPVPDAKALRQKIRGLLGPLMADNAKKETVTALVQKHQAPEHEGPGTLTTVPDSNLEALLVAAAAIAAEGKS